MRFDDFIDGLHRAGWTSPNDAQYTHIKELWRKLFPAFAEARTDNEECVRGNSLTYGDIRAVVDELRAWREGGLTEAILRNQDGYIKVGRGCLLVSEHHLEEKDATIAALEAERDALKARCELYKEKERP